MMKNLKKNLTYLFFTIIILLIILLIFNFYFDIKNLLKARVYHYSDKKCTKLSPNYLQGHWNKVGQCGKESPIVFSKFLNISKDKTSHRQFYDSECSKPKSKIKTVNNNSCQPSTTPGAKSFLIKNKFF